MSLSRLHYLKQAETSLVTEQRDFNFRLKVSVHSKIFENATRFFL